MPRVDKTCPHCKAVFPCNTWHKKKFCSAECRIAGGDWGKGSGPPKGTRNAGSFKPGQVSWNKTPDVFVDCVCGKPVRVPPHLSGRKKFCSKACFYAGRVVTMTFQKGHPDLVPKSSRGHDIIARSKMSATHRRIAKRGPENFNWRGGLRTERRRAMGTFEYKDWRKAVFERDGYKCQQCGIGKPIEADHIKPWCRFPDLRYDIDNGRTLCNACHRATNTWGRRALAA